MVKARVSISDDNSEFCLENNITLSNTINEAIERIKMNKIVIMKSEKDTNEYWNNFQECYVLEESKFHVVVGSEYQEVIQSLKNILDKNSIIYDTI